MGKELPVSIFLTNPGGEPVDDMYYYFEAKVDPVKDVDTRKVDIQTHADGLRKALQSHAKSFDTGVKGITVGKGHGMWTTMTFPALTKDQVDLDHPRTRSAKYSAWGVGRIPPMTLIF